MWEAARGRRGHAARFLTVAARQIYFSGGLVFGWAVVARLSGDHGDAEDDDGEDGERTGQEEHDGDEVVQPGGGLGDERVVGVGEWKHWITLAGIGRGEWRGGFCEVADVFEDLGVDVVDDEVGPELPVGRWPHVVFVPRGADQAGLAVG